MKFPISKYKIHGNSMIPTLKEGEEVLTFNWGKIHEGDVVVIKHNDREMVKRIQNVHDQEYFVEGDNKKESTDSRHFGSIDKSEIIGKMVMVVR